VTKLTRYILVSFLRPLIFSFASLCLLVFVGELMDNLNKFLRGNAGVRVVGEYLLALLPVRSVELFPVAALLAALFSLGNLSRRREVTAAMSGGLHPWKLVQPLLWTGVVLSLLSWFLGEAVVPMASRRAKTLWNMEIRHFTNRRQTVYDQVQTVGAQRTFYSTRELNISAGTMEYVVIEETVDGKIRRQFHARSAEWRPKGWFLREGTVRNFDPTGVRILRQVPFQERQTQFRDSPDDLVPQQPDSETMSTRELKAQLDRMKRLGVPTQKMEVDLRTKVAFPWANLIVLLVGIPFAFNKEGGKVKAVGFALGVAFFYFGLMQVGRALGQKDWCPPIAAAWLANACFLVIGLRLFWRMRKLA
jgi:lipopolysaccharide export system permease protein